MSKTLKCDCKKGKFIEREREIKVKPDNKSMTKVFLKCTNCDKEIETLEQWRINQRRYVACVGYYE